MRPAAIASTIVAVGSAPLHPCTAILTSCPPPLTQPTRATPGTERVHDLSKLPGGGLACRFLRFVPLDGENGGALRVQAYGAADEEQEAKSGGRGRRGGRRRQEAARRSGGGGAGEEELYSYTLAHAAHGPTKFYADNGFDGNDNDWRFTPRAHEGRNKGKHSLRKPLANVREGRDPDDAGGVRKGPSL